MYVKTDLDRSLWHVASPLHNKLAEPDRPVHAWYRFVLSFPPHLVREYLAKFQLVPGDILLDPFCGTGTTLVEAKKHGIGSIGIEANAVAALASRVKTDWSVWPAELTRVADWAAEKAAAEISRVLPANPERSELIAREQLTLFGLRTLDAAATGLLLQGSISPKPLHRALVLRKVIQGAPGELVEALNLALAWALVSHAGNVRFGPEVGITKPKDDCDVVGIWRDQVLRMAGDLEAHAHLRNIPSQVIRGDSRDVSQIEDASISGVFTSPPYPNEKDYTRTTRLESVVLGLIKTKQDLRDMKEALLRSNTRNVYVSDHDDVHIDDIPDIQRIAEEIEARRVALGKDSGFERLYHRVTKLYFGGMARHLAGLRPKLRDGAMLGYVVGDQASYLQVPIATGQLLAQIAERLGYEVVSIDLFRTRLATATKQQLREEVLVLRWRN